MLEKARKTRQSDRESYRIQRVAASANGVRRKFPGRHRIAPEKSLVDRPPLDDAGLEELSRSLVEGLRRRGVDTHTAEDALQEAWLRTLRNCETPPHRLRAWLRVVANRVLEEFSRQRRARMRRESAAAGPDMVSTPTPASDSRVLSLVHELPTPYREVLWMRYVDDLPLEEVARRLHRSPGTIRSQLKRGLERLRLRLDEDRERRIQGLGVLAFLRRFAEQLGRRPWRVAGMCTTGVVLGVLASWLASNDVHASYTGSRSLEEGQIALVERTLAPPLSERVAVSSGPASAGSKPLATFARDVSGTVHAPDGSPLADAEVWRGSSDGKRTERVAVSDGLGRFAVENVELMELLWASHEVYLPSPRTQIAAGPQGHVNLTVEAPAGFLEAALRDPAGVALSGVPVELEWDRELLPTELFVAEGGYQIAARSLGTISDSSGTIVLPTPSRSRATLRVHRESGPPLVRDVELRPGRQVLELRFDEPLALTGMVLDEQGRPAPGARVRAIQNPRDPSPSALSDARGRFRVEGLSPGECAWTVDEDPVRGCGATMGTLVLSKRLARPPPDLRIELSSRWAIRGRVVRDGQPVAGVAVRRAEAIGLGAVCRTDADGRFAVPCYSEKQCTLKVAGASEEWSDRVVPCPAGTDGLEIDLAAARPVVARTIEFTAEDAGSIPTLVELRVHELGEATIRPVDDRGRCAVTVPLGAEVSCLAMVPGLGPWRVGPLDFAAFEVVHVRVPAAASVVFDVELPADVPSVSIAATLQMDALGRGLYDATLRTVTRLALTPTERPGSYSARVMPGTFGYCFRGAGLTHLPGTVSANAGERVTRRVDLVPGIAAEVDVALGADGVAPHLFFETPGGKTTQLVAQPERREIGHAHFTVVLPLEATAIRATTAKLAGRVPVDSIALVPGELARFAIELRPQ